MLKLLTGRVGDEYGEKSKEVEKDRNGDSRDLSEDPLGELVCNRLSARDDGPLCDKVGMFGSKRLFGMRAFGANDNGL
jgi:hypothetical protein